jgi:hypothetical protein
MPSKERLRRQKQIEDAAGVDEAIAAHMMKQEN